MLLLFLDSRPRDCVSMVLGGVSRDIVPRLCRGCRRGDEGDGLLVGDTLATRPLGSRGLLSLKGIVMSVTSDVSNNFFPFAEPGAHDIFPFYPCSRNFLHSAEQLLPILRNRENF